MRNLVATCALLVGAVAAPAGAATVVGATLITITNALPDWLQVAEVQAVTFASVNVAAAANGGTASGSPEYQNNGFATPGKAIDGVTGGNYYSDFISHSGTPNAGQYLTVNFSAPATLASLTIFGRTDGAGARDLYNVTIFGASNTVLYSGQYDARNGAHPTLSFDAPAPGVPEPQSWALMIAGFGLVGAAMRRRQAQAAGA